MTPIPAKHPSDEAPSSAWRADRRSQSPSRAALLCLVVLGASFGGAAALVPAAATAAGISASGHVTSQGKAYRGSGIERFTTTVDPEAGTWISRVTFKTPQTPDNAGNLVIGLTPVGQRLPVWGWTAHTDPTTVGVPTSWGQRLPTAFTSTPLPLDGTSVAFEPGNTVLVLRVTSESLKGLRPDTVGASLARPQTDAEFSVARAFLGPKAPKSVILPAAQRLTLGKDRTIRVPLAVPSEPADRRVMIYIGKHLVSGKLLPAKYYRRQVAVVQLDATNAARFRTTRTAKLALRTSLSNGSVTTASKQVTIQRAGSKAS